MQGSHKPSAAELAYEERNNPQLEMVGEPPMGPTNEELRQAVLNEIPLAHQRFLLRDELQKSADKKR